MNFRDNLALKRKPDILPQPRRLKWRALQHFLCCSATLSERNQSDRTETELGGRFPLFEVVSEGVQAAEEVEVSVMVQYALFCLSQDPTNS